MKFIFIIAYMIEKYKVHIDSYFKVVYNKPK